MKISIILEALTGSFETDMGRASKAAQKAARQTQEEWRQAGIVVGAAVAAATTALVALTKNSIDNADNLAKMAQKVGVSVEALSTLAYAADQSGINIESLQAGLVKLAKGAADAAMGTGTAIKGFDALGISVNNAEGELKGSDELLKEVADKFATFEDSAQKTALAVAIFGRAGADMIPLLNEGSEAIEEMEQRARDLGAEMDEETAKAAERFNDSLSDLGMLAKGLGNDLARELLPALNNLATSAVDSGIAARKGGEGTKFLADAIKGVIAVAYTGKAAIEALVNTVAGYVDVAAAGSSALLEMAENANPLTAAIKLANGELRSFGDIASEFEVKAGAALMSSTTGIADAVDGLGQNYARIYGVAVPANEAIEETGNKAKGAAPKLRDMAKEQAASEKAAKEAAKQWAAYEKALGQWILEAADASAETKRLNAEQAAHFAGIEKGLQFEIDLLGMSTAERERALIAMEAENLARDRNGDVVEEEREKFEKLLKVQKEAQKLDDIVMKFDVVGFDDLLSDIERVREALANSFGVEGPERVAELEAALGGAKQEALLFATDAIGQGLTSLKSLATEGTSAYRALETAQAALNVVTAVGAIAKQGMGDPYTAFARIAAMIAAMQSLGIAVSGSAGGGGSNGSAARQEAQGTGTVLGDITADSESALNAMEITADATSKLVGINMGMLRALNSLQAGIGSASGMLARGAASVDVGELASGTGGFLGSLPSFGLTDAIFGGRQELIDSGIVIMGGALNDMLTNISVGAFNTIETDGGWFSGDDVDTGVTDITEQFGTQFQLIIRSIVDTVREGALALGLLPADIEAALNAFAVAEIEISLKDLSAEEQAAELQAVFSSIFDELAGDVVPFVEQFQQVGEGLGETLVRVATSVQVMQEAMTQLGLAIDVTDPEQFAQISVGLIEMAGGVDAFITGMQTFVNEFATEEHKFAIAQDALTRAFEQVGLVVPETREAMWALRQSLDATTVAGQEQIATLLRLAGTAGQYYSMLEQQQEEAAEIAEEAARAVAEAAADAAERVQDIMSELRDQLTDAQQAINEFDMSPLAIELARIQAETQAAITSAAADGATDFQLLEIRINGMARAAAAAALAALDFEQQLDEWTFEDALAGMSDFEQQLANNDRIWQQRLDQAIEIFGEGSDQAVAVLDLWSNSTERFTDAANEASAALVTYTGSLVSVRGSIQDILAEANIGVRGDGLTEQQRAIAEVNARFRQFEQGLRDSLIGFSGSATARRLIEEQISAGLIELAELRLEALANLEAEWAAEIAAEREALYEREMEWIRRLQGIQDNLLLDANLSPLTPAQMLAEAQAQYDEALAGVQAGDLASRDLYESALLAYLEQARDYYSSSQPYLDIFDQIIANNQGLIDSGIADLGAQVAADAINAPMQTVDELRGLRDDGDEQTEAVVQKLNEIQVSQAATVVQLQAAVAELRELRLSLPRVG